MRILKRLNREQPKPKKSFFGPQLTPGELGALTPHIHRGDVNSELRTNYDAQASVKAIENSVGKGSSGDMDRVLSISALNPTIVLSPTAPQSALNRGPFSSVFDKLRGFFGGSGGVGGKHTI